MTWYTTHFQLKKEDEKTPTVGVEPTTFGLEVQRASPLRHAGLFHSVKNHNVIKNIILK